MYVTFEEYTRFGYSLIPNITFPRVVYKAGATVEKWTLGRVTDEFLNPVEGGEEPSQPIERNKRGICEIADLLYADEIKPIGQAGVAIKSFSNEGYSETLADTTSVAARDRLDADIRAIMDTFFTREQLFRGVGW